MRRLRAIVCRVLFTSVGLVRCSQIFKSAYLHHVTSLRPWLVLRVVALMLVLAVKYMYPLDTPAVVENPSLMTPRVLRCDLGVYHEIGLYKFCKKKGKHPSSGACLVRISGPSLEMRSASLCSGYDPDLNIWISDASRKSGTLSSESAPPPLPIIPRLLDHDLKLNHE